jgi:hypothetical protein
MCLIDKIHGYVHSIIKEIQEGLTKVILPRLKKRPFFRTELGKNEVGQINFGIELHPDSYPESSET